MGPGRHHRYTLWRTEPRSRDPGRVWQDVGSHLGQEAQDNICGSLSGHDKLWELVVRSIASPLYPLTKDWETLKSYLTNGQNLTPISRAGNEVVDCGTLLCAIRFGDSKKGNWFD